MGPTSVFGLCANIYHPSNEHWIVNYPHHGQHASKYVPPYCHVNIQDREMRGVDDSMKTLTIFMFEVLHKT